MFYNIPIVSKNFYCMECFRRCRRFQKVDGIFEKESSNLRRTLKSHGKRQSKKMEGKKNKKKTYETNNTNFFPQNWNVLLVFFLDFAKSQKCVFPFLLSNRNFVVVSFYLLRIFFSSMFY